MEGEASLIRDRAAFAEHCTTGLERWWPNGIETPGLVLIRVSGTPYYWDGEDEGESLLLR